MSIKRRSLLISNPGVEGSEDYAVGTLADVQNLKKLLLSPMGGFWKEDEIIIRNKPSKLELLGLIGTLKNVDYALVLFSGHGAYSATLNDTILELNEREEINSKELRQGALKQSLILDCCRVITQEVILAKILEASKRLTQSFNPADCRLYYDKRIEECPKSLTVLYSCDIDETSGDTSKGGVFTYNLIESSREWISQKNTDTSKAFAILSIVSAFENTERIVKEISGNRQNPRMEKPREGPYFPFCIIA